MANAAIEVCRADGRDESFRHNNLNHCCAALPTAEPEMDSDKQQNSCKYSIKTNIWEDLLYCPPSRPPSPHVSWSNAAYICH